MTETRLTNEIMRIRDWLRNLAEDKTIPMDVKVYTMIWNEIQLIDTFLEGKE